MQCRFVVEATVEENVQRLSSQRAGAMDLSAAAGATRGKQAGQQEPLTVRYWLHSRSCTHGAVLARHDDVMLNSVRYNAHST